MRSFAVFLGLILLGFAGLGLLGYPAWLLISQFPGADPKFSRVASRVGMLILLLGFIFAARPEDLDRPSARELLQEEVGLTPEDAEAMLERVDERAERSGP